MWEKIKKNRTLHLCILLTGCALLFGAPALAADMVEGTTGNSVDKKNQIYSGYHALVIGCGDYGTAWQRLSHPVKDARKVASALTSLGWTVDLVENPDGETLQRSLGRLAFNTGKDPDKAIFVWYSGLGYNMAEADGTELGYLVPVDAPDPAIDPFGFTETAVSLRRIEALSRQIRSRHVLMVLDADMSGDGLQVVKPGPLPKISPTAADPVRQFIISGSTGTTASSFTLAEQFLQGLTEGQADLNRDRGISGEELGAYLQARGSTDGRGRRLPLFCKIDNPRLDKGDFLMPLPGVPAGKAGPAAVSSPKAALPEPGQEIRNPLGMEFVYIPPGSFIMGSRPDEPGRDTDEIPHKVTLTRGIYMQTTEVTQGQWLAVMGKSLSKFTECGDNCPVEMVTWDEARLFVDRLNRLDGKNRYHLPTEAQWEYACRAGTAGAVYSGQFEIIGKRNAPALNGLAWYGGNSCADYPNARDCTVWKETSIPCAQARCGPQPAGRKAANPWGLYDMLGNVQEWCQDWYGKYPPGEVIDPAGPATGSRKVSRGGSWDSYAKACRSANRNHFFPARRSNFQGFRLVKEP